MEEEEEEWGEFLRFQGVICKGGCPIVWYGAEIDKKKYEAYITGIKIPEGKSDFEAETMLKNLLGDSILGVVVSKKR